MGRGGDCHLPSSTPYTDLGSYFPPLKVAQTSITILPSTFLPLELNNSLHWRDGWVGILQPALPIQQPQQHLVIKPQDTHTHTHPSFTHAVHPLLTNYPTRN